MTKRKKKNTHKQPAIIKMTPEEIADKLDRIAKSNVDKDIAEIFELLINGNAWMCDQIEKGLLTIAKLRKLFQIQGSEKAVNRNPRLKNTPGQKIKGHGSVAGEAASVKSQGHGKNGADAYGGAAVVRILHPELRHGGICPAEACGGRLYEMSDPGIFVKVVGAPLATATRYELQKLRCSICEVIYTSPLPKEVGTEKYDANFVSMLMINKYFMSVPLYRQDRLQDYLGIPLPDSTQWDLMYRHKPMLEKLHHALWVDAANGIGISYDDTSVKILSEIKTKKAAVKGEKKQHNCFTTGIVSAHEDHRTYVFMSDNRTAGKCVIEMIKKYRAAGSDAPILMCDALTANIPQEIADDLYVLCYCLVHARRQFYELAEGYDDLADEVIRLIGNVYDNESWAKQLSAEDRLKYHQKNSEPIMKELKEFLTVQQSEFEPNSVAGKAIDYILNRWTELTQFMRHANAPIDNNITEQALKLVIQTRKSSMFYKSLDSAAFASYVQSALYSAAQNDINPCVYMTALLENEAAVIKDPYAWLPWSYQKTFRQIREVVAMNESSQQAVPDSG